MFSNSCPIAWTYHRHSSRWPHNVLSGSDDSAPPTFKESPGLEYVAFDPSQCPEGSLEQALGRRESCRRFAAAPVTRAELAGILQVAYGVRERVMVDGQELLVRPVPSAGGLYPLEIYVLARAVADLPSGVYHYLPLSHALEVVQHVDFPAPALSHLFMGQPYVAHAGMIIVISAMIERTTHKYEERGYRYILLEAGHVAQNINLVSGLLGLGSLNLGGFFDDNMANLLGQDGEEEMPLYGIAVGRRDEAPGVSRRVPPGGFTA